MPTPDSPNLVLAVLDTTRADELLDASRLPGVRDLMGRGTVFSRAISPAPWTLPAHGSLFSGLLPHEHGLTGDVAVGERQVHPVGSQIEALADRWLPEVLRRAGYRTFGASANPWITPRMGWSFGFDRFEEVWRGRTPRFMVGEGARAPRTRWLPRPVGRAARWGYRKVRAVLATEDSGAVRSLAAFGDWLPARGGDGPYFAFFNFMEAHLPYLPPRPFGPRSALGRLRASRVHAGLTNEFVVRYNVGREELPEGSLALLRELYRAELAYLDARLSDLVSEIDRGGRATVLVIVGDHGENLGEHHLLGHQASLAHTLLWVPLILSGPSELVGRGEVAEPVSTLGVHETLLHLAGVADDRGLFERDGGEPALAWYESAYSEAAGARQLADGELSGDPRALRILKTRAWAAYRGPCKLIVRSDGSRALFDIDADSGETNDLSATRPDLLRAFDELALPLEPALVGARPARATDLDEIERHLESLGYL